MKFLLLLVCFAVAVTGYAQMKPQFVAARAGLNLRDKPSTSGRVLINIPYATELTMQNDVEAGRRITTEGLTGYWRKIKYKDKEGYIIDSYLLPVPPPAKDVKTLIDFIAQTSSTFGDKLIVKSNTLEEDDAGGYEMHKQLYKNGSEVHSFQGYEFGSATCFLPEFSMQEGFILLRLIPEFNEVFGAKDPFPVANKTFKKGEYEYSIRVEKEQITDIPWIKKISIEYESGVIYTFEMYQVDTQLVIYLGAGV